MPNQSLFVFPQSLQGHGEVHDKNLTIIVLLFIIDRSTADV